MNLPKGFKQGIIPKGSEDGFMIICKKCGFISTYIGTAQPEKNLKCPGCLMVKKGFRKSLPNIKRNPRIIHRNNLTSYRRK